MSKLRSLLLLLVLAAPACWSTFLPGRCDKTSDCGPGLVCDLTPTPELDGRCVMPDAGGQVDGAAGGAGQGDGGRDTVMSGAAGAGDSGQDAGAGVGGGGGSGRAGSDASGDVVPEVKPGCTSSTDCPPATPICDAGGACRRCDANTVSSNACSTLDAAKPACGPDGRCVVCASSADCKADPTKPICDVANQACAACTSDTQCADKLGMNPGVCMAHQNGRCATDAETFYVSNVAGCSDTATGAGTATMPFCTLEPAAMQVGGSRTVIVVRGSVLAPTSAIGGPSEVSLVGQQTARVLSPLGPNALHISATNKLYARGVSITADSGVGVVADNTSTIRLDHVVVSNSAQGGISLGGAAFDISNTTVTGNGPGTEGASFWGGIDIQFPPSAGPKRLNFITVTNNKAVGILCSAGVMGAGALATGNSGGDVGPLCGFAPCALASASCGAQP
jgi:hypothetical protein